MEKAYDLQIFDTLPSTNTYLQELAEQGAPSGTAVLARHQTAGRGRMGRSFFSPSRTGLYMSLLLRLDESPETALLLTPMAAVAAAEGIEAVTGKHVQIKWVNDLFLCGKKVCGILAQSKLSDDGKRLAYAVIGIGINLTAPQEGFPSELSEIAGALYEQGEQPSEGLLETLAEEILSRLMELSRELTKRTYLPAYRERLCMLGRRITVAEQEQEAEATALAVDDDLRLLVEYADGRREWRSTGEIRIRL